MDKDKAKEMAKEAASLVDKGVEQTASAVAASVSAVLARGCELWETAKVRLWAASGVLAV
jgi:hypothetical protein